jgi:hypothetical protein
LQGSYEECLRHLYILDAVNKSLAAGGTAAPQGDGTAQTKQKKLADHYAKEFEALYDAFNLRLGKR